MNLKNIVLIFTIASVFVACDSPTSDSAENDSNVADSTELVSKEEAFTNSIQKSHNINKFRRKEVVQFDINLIFGGKTIFNGSISMTPNGSMVKMEDSSKTIIWDGEKVHLSPDTADTKGARFGVFTWSYFFVAPYKLSDPGTHMELMGDKPLIVENSIEDSANGETFIYNTGRLTFDDGVGDSPDDWYMVYQDKESNLLACLAYVVTFGKSLEKAEQDPHAITYEAYTDIDGIPMATQWNFWTWNENGEMHKLLGEAMISKIRFIKKTDDLFKPSVNSILVEKPEV